MSNNLLFIGVHATNPALLACNQPGITGTALAASRALDSLDYAPYLILDVCIYAHRLLRSWDFVDCLSVCIVLYILIPCIVILYTVALCRSTSEIANRSSCSLLLDSLLVGSVATYNNFKLYAYAIHSRLKLPASSIIKPWENARSSANTSPRILIQSWSREPRNRKMVWFQSA